jgi:hypothetical protein
MEQLAAERWLRAWRGSGLWSNARFRTKQELRCLKRAGFTVETFRGAIYYPRLAIAARLMARYDRPSAVF